MTAPRRLQRALLLGALLALLGCRARPAPGAPVALALADRVPVADLGGPATVLLFGTPEGERHQAQGFVPAGPRPGADPSAWVRRWTAITFRLEAPAPTTLILDLAPFPGLGGEQARLRANGQRITRWTLREGRHRYAFDLPERAQKAGVNKLEIVFGARSEPQPPHGHRLSGRLFALVIAPKRLAPGSGEPGPALSVEAEPGALRMGPGRLSVAFLRPRRAELRVRPRVLAAGVPAQLRVSFQVAGAPESVLWKGRNPEGEELRLSLPGSPGVRVRLSLGVEAPRGGWPVVSWGAARVLGEGGDDALGHPPVPTKLGPTVAAAHRKLVGANAVLVLLDAARAREFGCYGYPRATTPRIDALARQGVVFERAYTTAVFTLSAMSSLWTSLYPGEHHHGVAYDAPLPDGPLTLAQALSARGVHTAAFVMNAMAGEAFGLERGFEEFHEVFARGSDASAMPGVVGSFLARNPRQPFFLYLHFREPHFPYEPPAPFDRMFGEPTSLPPSAGRDQSWYREVNQGRAVSEAQVEDLRRLYDGNLAYADAQVGRITDLLREHGLLDRTLIVILADHGEALYEHGFISHTEQVYEESTHIPLVVRPPRGVLPPGLRIPSLVNLLDVAPTLAEVTPGPPPEPFEGRSLLSVALGAGGRRAVVSRAAGELSVYGLRDDRYKYILSTRNGWDQLFDIEADPGERHDLSDARPVVAAYYRQLLLRHVLGVRHGPEGTARPVRLTPEQRENLRSLGYLK